MLEAHIFGGSFGEGCEVFKRLNIDGGSTSLGVDSEN